MQLVIIQTKKNKFQLIDLDDCTTECVALLGRPTYIMGLEYGSGVEIDGYYVEHLNANEEYEKQNQFFRYAV